LYHSLGAADRANCGGPTEPNTHSVIQGAREAILHVQPRSRLQTPLRLPKLPQRTLRFLIVSRLNFAHGADFSLHFAHASPSFLPALDGCKPAEEPANPSESSIPPREPKISRPIITAQAKTHQNIVERPPWTAPQKHPKVEQFGQSAEQRFRGDESEFVAVCNISRGYRAFESPGQERRKLLCTPARGCSGYTFSRSRVLLGDDFGCWRGDYSRPQP